MTAYRATRIFFIRNYEAIKLGLLAAILVTTLMMLNNQTRTLREVLNVNEQVLKVSEQIKTLIASDGNAREEARAQSQARDEVIIQYLKCIALIKPENRTSANIQECVDSARVQATTPSRDTQTPPIAVPQQQQSETPRQNPTTSGPPDQPAQEPVKLLPFVTGTIQQILNEGITVL